MPDPPPVIKIVLPVSFMFLLLSRQMKGSIFLPEDINTYVRIDRQHPSDRSIDGGRQPHKAIPSGTAFLTRMSLIHLFLSANARRNGRIKKTQEKGKGEA
jgi:hypothetical protein